MKAFRRDASAMILGASSSSNGGGKNERSIDSFFPTQNSDLKTTNKSAKAAVFDPFFGIRILSTRFTLDTFNIYCAELRRTKLSSLNLTTTTANSTTMGVIVETTGMRKSSNGKDYLIWHLSDFSDSKTKLLIFGEAAQAHWKLNPGFVVAIANAELATDNNNATSTQYIKQLTLKVMKSLQVLSLGLSADFGTCTGLKKNGERCTNFVNTSLSPVCTFHIQSEAKKLRSFRSSLSTSSNERARSRGLKPSVKGVVERREEMGGGGQLFTVKRATSSGFQGKNSANLFTGSPSSLLAYKAPIGNKIMSKLAQEKKLTDNLRNPNLPTSVENLFKQTASSGAKPPTSTKAHEIETSAMDTKSPICSTSCSKTILTKAHKIETPAIDAKSLISSTKTSGNVLRDFINKKNAQEQQSSYHLPKTPNLAPAKIPPKPQFSLAEQAARKRAAEILQKSKSTDPALRKRKAQVEAKNEKRPLLASSSFTNDQIRKLLAKKSVHEHEVEQADREQEVRYFQKREVEERIETHATTLMEIKECNCKYTTPSLAQRCLDQGHEYTRHKATKRFFKCKDCQTRTYTFELMPTTPCTKCSCRQYIRVAMKDERKVINEREKLLVRGEERTFVNI